MGGHYLGVKYATWLLPRPRSEADHADAKKFIMSRPACDALMVHSAEYVVIALMSFLYKHAKRCEALYDEGSLSFVRDSFE